MVDFLYHGADDGDESPFEEVIAEIVADGQVSVASPFLDLDILQTVADATDNFRVLTDFEAWFSAEPSAESSAIRDFVDEHAGSLRDLPGLHAKLVLGEELAYLGSANLTKSGLAKNRELGVSLTESEQLRELGEWFDSVWQLGDCRTEEEIEALFDSTSAEREQTGRASTEGVTSFHPDARVNSSLTALVGTGGSDDEAGAARMTDSETRDRLISRLSKTPGRWWAERYFELVEHLLDATGLESGDPRLVTTIPKSYERLCVSINNRYVFTGMWQADSDFGFMVGPDFELPSGLEENIVYPGYGYEPHAQEEEEDAPRFLAFEVDKETTVPDELIENWTRYMKLEAEYRSGSMFQQHHEPIVCAAALDDSFREELLSVVFD